MDGRFGRATRARSTRRVLYGTVNASQGNLTVKGDHGTGAMAISVPANPRCKVWAAEDRLTGRVVRITVELG